MLTSVLAIVALQSGQFLGLIRMDLLRRTAKVLLDA
jgi:hypothetical protein